MGFGMGRDTGHGPKRKTVIAAKKDREAVSHGGLGGLGQRFGPGDGLGQRVQGLVRVAGLAERRGHEIAQVAGLPAKLGEGLSQASGTVGIWPHQAAIAAFAAIDRGTEEETRLGHRVSVMSRVCCSIPAEMD